MIKKKAVIAIILAIIISIVVYSFFFKMAVKQGQQPDEVGDDTTMLIGSEPS